MFSRLIDRLLASPVAIVMSLSLVQTLVLSFLLALVLVRYSIHAARKYRIFAHASERASHVLPTPRLAGLGFAASFYITCLLMNRWAGVRVSPWNAALFVGGGYALVGGFLDDILELSPRWKFLFQFAAAGTALLFGFRLPGLELPGGGFLQFSPLFGSAITFVFIVSFMNAFNFMDGMDGQAGLFGVIACAGMLSALAGQDVRTLLRSLPEILILATLAGALSGFLAFNLPTVAQESKSFMGDSGSQFVGFALAIFTVRLDDAPHDVFPTIGGLLLLSPFIFDVVYTLLRRISRHENILRAHRSHLYQRLLIAGWSHGHTLVLNCAIWLGCLGFAHFYGICSARQWRWLAWATVACDLALLFAYALIVHAVERQHASKSVAAQSKMPSEGQNGLE